MRKEDWIKVSDRLPEVDGIFEHWNLVRLLYAGSIFYDVLHWTGFSWIRQSGERADGYVGLEITHWMPIVLPEEE